MNLQPIIKKTGLEIIKIEPVGGGDINEAYCLYGPVQKYFLKVNDAARFSGMFKKEGKGLQALQSQCNLVIPKVIECGEVEGKQFLVLEWLEKGAAATNFWIDFGTALAQMHKQSKGFFGFDEDNYIGSLPQINSKHQTWGSFYAECRILPLVKKFNDTNLFSSSDINHAENFCKKIDEIFPAEPASLLHGDLWGGNYMIVQNGSAAIYDPAVYYGHREMDLGMTLLFGGFSTPFYDAYNRAYPLEKNWRQRIPYTQLYPLLVHAILFGGHYIQSAREILMEF